jgi:Protein of unknown function (DUF3224)
MRKFIVSLTLTVATVGSLFGGASVAGAATNTVSHGVGTYQVTGATVRSATPIGTSTLIDQTLFIDNAGVLNGPSSADVRCLIKADGTGACAGVETFNGTIGNRSGTAHFAVGITIDATGFHGAIITLNGTGELAGLHGAGRFEGTTSGTNSFDYSFAD